MTTENRLAEYALVDVDLALAAGKRLQGMPIDALVETITDVVARTGDKSEDDDNAPSSTLPDAFGLDGVSGAGRKKPDTGSDADLGPASDEVPEGEPVGVPVGTATDDVNHAGVAGLGRSGDDPGYDGAPPIWWPEVSGRDTPSDAGLIKPGAGSDVERGHTSDEKSEGAFVDLPKPAIAQNRSAAGGQAEGGGNTGPGAAPAPPPVRTSTTVPAEPTPASPRPEPETTIPLAKSNPVCSVSTIPPVGGNDDAPLSGESGLSVFVLEVDPGTTPDAMSESFLYDAPGQEVVVHIPPAETYATLEGDDRDNTIIGGPGNSAIWGYGGNDMLVAGAFGGDSHELYGGDGDDVLNVVEGDGLLNGGAGNDFLQGALYDDVLDGGKGQDTLNGGGGFDSLTGGLGNDLFILPPENSIMVIEDFTIGEDKLLGDPRFVASTSDTYEGGVWLHLINGSGLFLAHVTSDEFESHSESIWT